MSSLFIIATFYSLLFLKYVYVFSLCYLMGFGTSTEATEWQSWHEKAGSYCISSFFVHR